MTKKKTKNAGSTRKGGRTWAYPVEFRLRIVKLFLEEGYSAALISAEFGISKHSILRWVSAYRQGGVEGLTPKPRPGGRPSVTPEIRERAIAVKQAHPEYGPRRIAEVLKRFFLIPTSQATVHKTLSEKGLVNRAKRKPVRNPPKPRFFERARPNQLWQSDIMTFRLAGRNAYLIGFMDDYSRYITALGLYRSQTAEHVLETYRRGVAEYGVPKEMLTDNGRQYTNWRGKTRFEREMKKDRVKHIRSRPHHPMTLGKIERFWKSILGEFLQRTQFDSFEQAVQRTVFWVKYYNHKRPHQGIGGLCPADRFFEIAHDLKQTLQRGVEENVLELALRGRPLDPFYMVGRMGGQSVVIRAEKGKLRMLVDEASHEKELVYDARKDIDHEDNPTNSQGIRSAAENHGRVVDLERAPHERPGVSGTFDQPDAFGAVAEPGDRRYAQGPGPHAEGPAATHQPAVVTADRKEAGRPEPSTGEATQNAPAIQAGTVTGEADVQATAPGAAQSRADHEGALRADYGPPGSRSAGGLAQDLLQVGAAGTLRPFGQCDRPATGAAAASSGRPSSMAGEAARGSQSADRVAEPQNGTEGCADGSQASVNRQRPGEKKMTGSDRRWP
ncbi:MAG: IS481 family transposase [Desulfobacteraceae bacterium]